MLYQNINTGKIVYAKRWNGDNIEELADFLALNVAFEASGGIGYWIVADAEKDEIYEVAGEVFELEYKKIEATVKCKDCEYFSRFGSKKKMDKLDGECFLLAIMGRDDDAIARSEDDYCWRWASRKAPITFRESIKPCNIDSDYEPKGGCSNSSCISCGVDYWEDAEVE